MKDSASDSKTRSFHGETFEVSEQLQGLLDQWESLRKSGKEVTADELCGDNEELREELDAFLKAEQFVSHFDHDLHIPMPKEIGPYQILSELGRGGHAVVYLALQRLPSRKVALKLLQNVGTRPRLESRFRLEIELLGTLSHPNTARIFEAGMAEVFATQHLYYTMEYIDGQDLLSYVRDQKQAGNWGHRDTLRLCLNLCEALSEAHAQGVVHRDLKPGNILVDSEGNPKLIDFGLARTGVLGAEGRSGESTADGWVGTRLYMSPEQFGGDPAQVDARTDVYGFAVVLYQLLVDALPYPIEKKTMWETARLVKETLPVPPSRRNPEFRGDVDVILETALAKEPSERYPTIDALADDLRACLEGRPISARRLNAAIALMKWCRRHRRAAVGSVLSVAVIATLAVSALIAAKRASERALELDGANRILRMQTQALADSNRRYDGSVRRLERSVFNQSLLRLGTLVDREPNYVLSQLDDEEVFSGRLRGYTWKLLRAAADQPPVRWVADPAGITDVAISRDGSRVAACGPHGVFVWEVATQDRLAKVAARADSPVVRLFFDRTGEKLLFSREDHKVLLLDINSGHAEGILRPVGYRPTALSHSNAKNMVLIGDESGIVQAWNETGKNLIWEERLADERIVGITVSEDQSTFAAATEKGTLVIGNLASGESIDQQKVIAPADVQRKWIRARFAADLATVYLSSEVDDAMLWDLDAGLARMSWGHRGLLPDGEFLSARPIADAGPLVVTGRRRVETMSGAKVARTLYRSADEEPSQPNSAQENSSDDVKFEPIAVDVASETNEIAVALRGGEVMVYRGGPIRPYESWAPANEIVGQLEYSPRGDLLVTASSSGVLATHSVATGDVTRRWQSGSRGIGEVQFLDSDRFFVTRGNQRGLVLWDATKGQDLNSRKMPRHARRMACIGNRLLVGLSNSTPIWVPIEGGPEQPRLGEPTGEIESGIQFADYDASSQLVVTSTDSFSFVLWRLNSDGTLERLGGNKTGQLKTLLIRPGGEKLLVGTRKGVIQVWSLPGLQLEKTLQPNATALGGLAFSSDGQAMASGHFNGEVLFWDVVNWEPQLSVQTNLSPIREMQFSTDGHLAVGGKGPEMAIFQANQ